MADALQRFIFENCEVRGEHVQLEQAYQDVLASHHYPPGVARLLGEFIAAASLLSATLKFEGSLSLQVRGDGEVPLIMAETNDKLEMRAIAQGASEAMSSEFQRLLGGGQLAITIDPKMGNRYQGIVSLDGASLAECLENYFRQSEQLSTRLWLCADGQRASGLMLQELPSTIPNPRQWQHLTTLADTVTDEELLGTNAQTLLYRLYHQDPLRVFEPQQPRFKCSCSRERIETALVNLGDAELSSILQEQGQIETHCEFCNRRYTFSANDFPQLAPADTPTRH